MFANTLKVNPHNIDWIPTIVGYGELHTDSRRVWHFSWTACCQSRLGCKQWRANKGSSCDCVEALHFAPLVVFAVTVALCADGFTSISSVLTAMTVAVDAIPNAIRIVMIGSIDEMFLTIASHVSYLFDCCCLIWLARKSPADLECSSTWPRLLVYPLP